MRADLCKLYIVYKTHKHFHSLWMCRVGLPQSNSSLVVPITRAQGHLAHAQVASAPGEVREPTTKAGKL